MICMIHQECERGNNFGNSATLENLIYTLLPQSILIGSINISVSVSTIWKSVTKNVLLKIGSITFSNK